MTTSRTQQSGGSPPQSEQGATTIQDAVVVSIAAMAIRELDGLDPSHGGIRLPGDTSPTIGELVDNLTGGGGRTRGVSVEVGEEVKSGKRYAYDGDIYRAFDCASYTGTADIHLGNDRNTDRAPLGGPASFLVSFRVRRTPPAGRTGTLAPE